MLTKMCSVQRLVKYWRFNENQKIVETEMLWQLLKKMGELFATSPLDYLKLFLFFETRIQQWGCSYLWQASKQRGWIGTRDSSYV